jgi:hypothetical protein
LSHLFGVALALALLLGAFPLVGSAQEGALVAVDPPEMDVDPGATFTVTVTIEDAVNLGGYEFELNYDPAVVAVDDVEAGGFLEEAGRDPLPLGPTIDAEAGSLIFGVASMGEGSGAEGDGDLAVLTLEALEDGTTVLNLRNMRLFDTDSGTLPVRVEDGRVRVGSGVWPTDVPTSTPFPTPTFGPTPTQEPTGTATSPPPATDTATPSQQGTPEVTASATATEEETPVRTATSSATPTEPTEPTATPAAATAPASATPSPSATATQAVAAAETGAPTETDQVAETPRDGTEEAVPTATATAGAQGAATERPATSETDGDEGGPTRDRGWLIAAAVVLGLLGLALIGGGIYILGPRTAAPAASEQREE